MTITCCSTIVRSIEIDTPTGPLSMGYCARCDSRRWFLGNTEVQIRYLLSHSVTQDWRASRNWKKQSRLHAVA